MTRNFRVLGAGIDSVYLSARGTLRDDLLPRLAQQRSEAELSGEPVVVEFAAGESAYLLRPHGWRRYRYWLTSANVELFVGTAEPFPPVYVMLHSAYLHTVGAEVALAEVEAMLSRELFNGACVVTVSRADLYADVQGWSPRPSDADRFVCRAIRRRVYLAAAEAHRMRRELSGFTFGKGDLLARIYNKTRELAATGDSWPELLWEGADRDRPVWRVEFQFRSGALRFVRHLHALCTAARPARPVGLRHPLAVLAAATF